MQASTALLPISMGLQPLSLVCGLPSSPLYFAADLCRDLMARQHGGCEIVHLNDLGDTTIEKIVSISGPTLFLSELPDAAVVAMVRDAEFPVIVLDQSFVESSLDFMGARGANLLDTVRTMARAQMGVITLADIPRAKVIEVEMSQSATNLIEQIAEALAIPRNLCGDSVEARSLDRDLSEVLSGIFVHDQASTSEESDEVLEKLARFYDLTQDRGAVAWDVPIAVLLEGVPPHLPATSPIDLAGPARCLTLGPYLYLPPGNWSLRFSFTTAANESSNTLGFDVTADEEIKFFQEYTITTAGRFEFQCEFCLEDAFYPFEFRSFLRRGSIGGRFVPNSLVIESV